MKRSKITKLSDIKSRCIEVGECWEWQGARNSSGMPYVWFNDRTTPVRRVALQLHLREPIGPNEVASLRCGNTACVRPHAEHVVRCSQDDHRAYLSSIGVGCSSTAKRVLSARSRPGVVLSMEAARQARAEGLTPAEIAKRFGCSRASGYLLLAGEIWREQLPGASVFSLGGA